MNIIKFPTEPNRLHLIWQSTRPDNRKKFVVGELVRSQVSVSLTYHYYSDDIAEAVAIGFEGHPAFPVTQPVHHVNVLEVFSRRLPARNRTDFAMYLSRNRLPSDRLISDFSLLGHTGGALPSDGFYCAIDFRYETIPAMFLMEVAGFRYNAGMNVEIPDFLNKAVHFLPEEGNAFDPNAVAIYVGAARIGYVPRYYARLFRIWLLRASVMAIVERIDGTLTKPQVHLMVSVLGSEHARALANT